MHGSSFSKYCILIIGATVIFGGVLWFCLDTAPKSPVSESVSVKASAPVMASSAPAKAVEVVVNEAEPVKLTPAQEKREQRKQARMDQAISNVDHLRTLLDDESRRAEALDLAKKLLKDGIIKERVAALEALRWLGGRESVGALITAMKEEDTLSDIVDETLRNLIEESLYTDVRIMDKKSWLEAMEAYGTEDGMSVYLTLLSAFPEFESVPVLMEMYKSDKPLNKKVAQEFLEFIANGVSLPSLNDAQAWWQKWMDDRGLTEQDLLDYQNAGKEENSALAGNSNDSPVDEEPVKKSEMQAGR